MGQTGGQTKRGRINERGGEEDEVGGGGAACEEGGTGWSGDRCSSKGRRGKGDKNRKQEEARVGWEVKGGKGRGHRW